MLHQLLTMIQKWFSKYYRVLGTFKELLDFLPMGAVAGKMEFPTYLTRVLDLRLSSVVVFWFLELSCFFLDFPFFFFLEGAVD